MRILLFIAALFGVAALSAPVAAQYHPRTFSWREDPAGRDALIGALGTVYRFADRASPRSGGGGGKSFGGRPHSAGMRGLCELQTLTVAIDADGAPSGGFQSTLYSVVSDTAPGSWDDAYQGRLNEICGAPQEGWPFFTADDAVEAWYAVRLLSILRARAEADPAAFIRALACTGRDYCLIDPALLRAATAADLVSVIQRPCEAFDILSDDSYMPVRRAGCMTMVVNADPPGGGVRLLEIGVMFDESPSGDFAVDPVPRAVAVFVDQVIFD